MIVKMSKYAFMVYHREYDAFLTTLRELGVVHVKETNSVLDNAELQALLAERKQVSTAIRYCKNLNSQTKEVTVAPARGLTSRRIEVGRQAGRNARKAGPVTGSESFAGKGYRLYGYLGRVQLCKYQAVEKGWLRRDVF